VIVDLVARLQRAIVWLAWIWGVAPGFKLVLRLWRGWIDRKRLFSAGQVFPSLGTGL